LKGFIDTLDYRFDIIGLSETWQPLNERSQSDSLQGYHDFIVKSESTQNSRCGFYIKDTLSFKVREDLSFSFFSTEEEFQMLPSENIIACVIYRHPKGRSFNEFTKHLENSFKLIEKENKKNVIMGDFNMYVCMYVCIFIIYS